MKTMHKLLTLALVLTMLLSMALTATANSGVSDPYAIEPTAMNDTGTITIQNATAGTTYELYRILDIEMLSADQPAKPVFIMNSKWKDFILADEYEPGQKTFTCSGDYVTAINISSAADLQKLAARVVAHATSSTPKIENDGQSPMLAVSGDYTSSTGRQYGFYVMTSYANQSTTPNEKYAVFTLASANTPILEKNSSDANIEKFVQEDSHIDDPTTNGWGKVNAAEIGQEVQFKIVLTMAAGTDTYTVTDTMPNFVEITEASKIGVEYSRGGVDENDLTITVNEARNGFTVNILPSFRSAVLTGDTLTFTYSAKLKSTADLTSAGNLNTVTLTYGENKTKNDSTTTYTSKLEVTKVDESGNALVGAKFKLTHKDTGTVIGFTQDSTNAFNYIVTPGSNLTEITTAMNSEGQTKFTISGLDIMDVYVLEETEAPAGYVLMMPQEIQITDNNTMTSTVTVENLPGAEMPATGGMGTTLFYAVGGILVLAAVVLLVTKKRMNA